MIISIYNNRIIFDTLTVCDSLIWNSNSYNNSGDFIDTLNTQNGCDSIVHLNLTVNNSVVIVDTMEVCDSLSWNGNILFNSGLYTDSAQTLNGCDSINKLSLTIFESTSSYLNISSCHNYSWNNLFLDSSGIYIESSVNSNGCLNLDTLDLMIYDIPAFSAGEDTSICENDTIQLNAFGGVSYQWIAGVLDSVNNPILILDSSINLILEITDSNNCTYYDSIFIEVNQNPIAFAGNDTTVCYKSLTQLNASGGVIYNWSDSINLNHNNTYNPVFYGLNDSYQIVTVTDVNGCSDLDSIFIDVFKLNSQITNNTLCIGDSTEVIVSGDNLYGINWYPGNTFSDSTSSSTIIYHNNQSFQYYYYDAIDSNNCVFSDTLDIVMGDSSAFIDTNSIITCNGAEFEFDNQSNPAFDFNWSFSDGTSYNEKTVNKVFYFNSQFSVTLTVFDSLGCQSNLDIFGKVLSFDEYFKVSLPNVFTPNFDGDNDIFRVNMAGELNECSELSIFNRWGQLVYSSYGRRTPEWNGKNYSGLDVPTGQYYFQLLIKEKSFNGKLYLFR